MGTVPDLISVAVEPPREPDFDLGIGAASEEGFSRLAGTAVDDLRAARHELSESVVRCDNYSCHMRNCELLLRDLFGRVTEHLRVLEGDVGEQNDRGIDDVRGVEPAAQAGLDDRHVDGGFRKLEQRCRGQYLE